MALTLGDIEWDDDDDVFSSYNQPAPKVKPLDYAYQGLLEQRNKLLIPMSDSKDMTEDDLLLKTNLQTSALFNRLTEEFKSKQAALEEYNKQLLNIRESSSKFSVMMDNLKKTYFEHVVDSVHNLVEVNDKMIAYFKETNPIASDAIKKKISKIESDIYDIGNKLNGLRNIIVSGVNELVKEENKQKKICSVCFDKEVDTALVPCGHTYCNECAGVDRSRYARCPHCRTQINNKIKIFFSV